MLHAFDFYLSFDGIFGSWIINVELIKYLFPFVCPILNFGSLNATRSRSEGFFLSSILTLCKLFLFANFYHYWFYFVFQFNPLILVKSKGRQESWTFVLNNDFGQLLISCHFPHEPTKTLLGVSEVVVSSSSLMISRSKAKQNWIRQAIV